MIVWQMFQAKGGSPTVTGKDTRPGCSQSEQVDNLAYQWHKQSRPEGRRTIDCELVPFQLTSHVTTNSEDVLNCTVFILATGGRVISSISPDVVCELTVKRQITFCNTSLQPKSHYQNLIDFFDAVSSKQSLVKFLLTVGLSHKSVKSQ